ncbi:hypothetical protein HDU85_002852 [Gaertneriomyces sp. JEL0708]|nr:hypothetical protein HDU85_002852 [Gaertneriomyces sp. JEL0708]
MMALYWELASVDPKVRDDAAHTLLRALHQFQCTFTPQETDTESEDLEKVCAPDVAYGVKRLLRGLPSSRKGARQGFAVALTELLRSLEFLKVSTIFHLLIKLTQTLGAKGQEEKDILFGRIFGILAICQADMLRRPHTTLDETKELVTALLKYSSSKSYVRETCFKVLITILENIQGHALENEVIAYLVPAVLAKEVSTPEDLWFAVVAQSKHPEFDWASALPSWKSGSIYNRNNLGKVVEILKDSTFVSPRVHSVWEALLDVLLATPRPTQGFTLEDLWVSLDESLFNSTLERKHLGLLLFQRILPRLDAKEVPFFFTPQFMRTLMNHLAKPDNYLHKTAKQVAAFLCKTAQERNDIALQLVLQLVGKHQRFDSITKTKTVETIIGSLKGESIAEYVSYLQGVFLKPIGEEDDVRGVDQRRQWALDQMILLLKNGKLTKEEKWVQSIADCICMHAFFHVKKTDPSITALQVPSPELSEASRDICRDKFFNVLGYLVSLPLTVDGAKVAGVKANGNSWAYDLHLLILKLSLRHKSTTLVQPLDEEAVRAIHKGQSIIQSIHKKAANPDIAQNKEALARYKAFELLFVHVFIQVYADPGEAVGLLEELESCYNLVFEDAPKSQSSKKRKAAHDDDSSDTEEPAPMEVLFDILVSFMARPSALMRSLAEEAFKVFCSQMTKRGLEVIFEVLSTKSGVAGAQELFENENEDQMEIDDANLPDGDAHSDSESEDDDQESEEDDEDGAAAEVVDEELRLKVQEALGNAAVGDEDDSEEEEFLDDDQMEAFDEKLAEIFRHKKDIKTQKRDLKQQVLHFKFRVLDLLEIFIKKCPQHPLILDILMPVLKLSTQTSSTADELDLHAKLVSLIKNKLCKLKAVPPADAVNAEHAAATLKEVHEFARKATDGAVVQLCSGISILVVRVLAQFREDAEPPKATKKNKKRKSDVKEQDVKAFSRVASVYNDSLVDFLSANKTRLKPVIFLDLINRYPAYLWELLPTMVHLTSQEADPKAYNMIQAYNIMARLMKQTPKSDEQLRAPIVEAVWDGFTANVLWTLQVATEDAEGSRGLNKDRVRDLLKDLVVIARRTVSMIPSKEKMWKRAEIEVALTELVKSKRFESVPSIKAQSKQLLAVLAVA